MFLLPKKKHTEVKKVYIPVDLVLNCASQGLSEKEIKNRLQSQGFSSDVIDRALKIAVKESVNSEMPQVHAPAPPSMQMPEPMGMDVQRHPQPLGYPPERLVSPNEPRQIPAQQAAQPFTFEPTEVKQAESPMGEITIEEIIEGIVEEKWQEFEERLLDYERRDMMLQSQLDDLRKRMKDIEGSIHEREKGLTSKLDEFGGSVEHIEGRIGSIEKVFKDFLPELTQNIKNMSELVDKVKNDRN
ncbi:MAG: hypothetical protein JW700_02300 [Candidatus Aenigmarchaeota archaeon]|nr:hypothetical protein [Candidatus Aenigmarchaeota archaeon]